jgi:CAAX protease family protein
MDASRAEIKPKVTDIAIFTWVVVLLVSDLPNAVWQALIGEPPAWLFWVKIGLLLVLILTSLAWKPIQTVRPYFFLLVVLMLALWGMNYLRETTTYVQWENKTGWVWGMAAFQLLKLAVAFIMIIVLWLMGRRSKDFYLTRGQLNAPVNETNDKGRPGKHRLTWGLLGLILGICILPLTLLFFAMGNLPTIDVLIRALPLFPVAIIAAITNAFSEETQFRASLLGDLQKVIGPGQAIWLSAIFFGLGHYFGGAPAGIPGVLITGLLGALFAKCMLGSKGIVVSWFIHFCQNAVIYAFWAIGSIG